MMSSYWLSENLCIVLIGILQIFSSAIQMGD